MIETPDNPLEVIRLAQRLLARHRIEIGLLNVHPETLFELLDKINTPFNIIRSGVDSKKDDTEGDIYGIPFKQKLI
jgi:hypothetical protein